ncbi:MAG: hypothetical protein EOP83_28885 [Verrucomicrobiaceae bacterium]|nr:MAG: hypothetical protein EOP83_28885 [Verrucomicrobiaceae bacterium]
MKGRIALRGRVAVYKSPAKGRNYYIVGLNYATASQPLGTFLYTVNWALQAHETISLGVYSYPAGPNTLPPSSVGANPPDPIKGFTLNRQSTVDDLVSGFSGAGYFLSFFQTGFFQTNLVLSDTSPGYIGFLSETPNTGYAIYNTITGALMQDFLYEPISPRTDYKSPPGEPNTNNTPYIPGNQANYNVPTGPGGNGMGGGIRG